MSPMATDHDPTVMAGLPTSIGAGTRSGLSAGLSAGLSGISRTMTSTLRLAGALPRTAISPELDRIAFRARARGAAYDAWEMTFDTVVRHRLIERIVDRLLSEGVVERVVAVAIEHPATDRILTSMLDSPGLERLLVTIAQSETGDRLLEGVLWSEQLDRIVTHIAESDQVRVAVTQQGFGLADEVAGELRSRTAAADALLERVARSMIRRRRVRPTQAPGPGPVS